MRSRGAVFFGWFLCVAATVAQADTAAPAAQPVPPGGGTEVVSSRTAEEKLAGEVKALQARLSDLKERTFRARARLQRLQELVLGGDASAGAKAVVVHQNDMGSSFALESAAFALDGAPVYTKVDVNGDLDRRGGLEVFNGRVATGKHQLAVRFVYRGRGGGLYDDQGGRRFKVESSYTFDAAAGRVSTVRVTAFEKNGAEPEDRTGVGFDVATAPDEPTRVGVPPVTGSGGSAR